MEVVFGITHFNRFEILKMSLLALSKIDFNKYNIYPLFYLYDDCSNELEFKNFIENCTFNFSKIIRNDKNVGSTKNIHNMYCDFLENTNVEYFVNMDCDLIVSSDLPYQIFKSIKNKIGIISFYNSSNHKRQNFVKNIYGYKLLLIKNNIGSAGTLMKREILFDIISNVKLNQIGFDWDWSNYLNRKNIKIYVTYRSYFLHIGLNGENNKFDYMNSEFDRGLNFYFNRTDNKNKQLIVGLNNFFKINFIHNKRILMENRFFFYVKYFINTILN